MNSSVFEYLAADGPDPELAAEDLLYAPLIGSWDVLHRTFETDGSVSERDAEWHFTWIIGGRGVQDVLFEKGAPATAVNTAVRCFDAIIGAWRVTAMQPVGGEFVSLVGRRDGGRIVQQGAAQDGSSLERWTFSEMTQESFVWRGESSRDGGRTWRLDQEMRARRQN